MADFEVLELGPLASWDAKRFVDKDMTTQYIGTSANAVGPGEGSPFWHRHSQLEEIYIFLEGAGQMGLDDEVVEVGPGSVVRVGQGVWRAWRCSPDSPTDLRMLCVRSGPGPLAEVGKDAERDTERPLPW